MKDFNNKSISLHFLYYGYVILLCYNGKEVTFKEFNGFNKESFKAETTQLLNTNVAVFIVPRKKF